MVVDLGRLVADMNSLSVDTWRRADVGDQVNLKFREDSLTDHNLFELHLRHQELRVYRFDQTEETKSGADWEWWIGTPERGWLCLKIQAKRVYGLSYPELNHKAGAGSAALRQYEVLIDQCDSRRAEYPFHVFYNGWSDGRFRGADDIAVNRSIERHQISGRVQEDISKLWGCTVMPTRKVREQHAIKRGRHQFTYVPSYLEHSVPWSELIIPTFSTAGAGKYGGSKQDGAAILNAVWHRVEAITQLAELPDDYTMEHFSVIPVEEWLHLQDRRLHTNLPRYIQTATDIPPDLDSIGARRSDRVPRLAVVLDLSQQQTGIPQPDNMREPLR
ncbi:DUF6615 family protein [Nocardia vinacea]|uniref:DUF6615 family protein n=1 Tax=Nocardia vinacea TaxID=96468 RepID=UPI000593C3F8|nr:DUF6615 family protein [Nocardia vinacea]